MLSPRAAAVGRVVLSHLTRRRELYLAPLFYAALVAMLYHPLWAGTAGFGWDRIDSYWPDLAYLTQQFARGEFPLWNPYERAGYPAHADPQPGYFYPVHWLLALAGVVAGKVSWWFAQFEELLHDVLLASFLYAYLRARRLPWTAALFGGAAAVLSGTWLGDKTNNFMETLAWTPLCWLAFDRLIERLTWQRAVALAASLYMAASSGSPPGYFYLLLALLPYAAWRTGAFVIARLRRRALDAGGDIRRPLFRLGALFGLAGILTLATQALLLLPALELTKHSIRASHLRDLSYALDGYIGWLHSLLGIVAPQVGTAITYMGLFALLCILFAITLGVRRDGGVVPLFFVTGAFFLVLAFGSQTPVLGWLVAKVPGFDMFRACARYRIVFGLCWVVVAAHGFALLLEPGWWQARRHRLLLLAGLAAVLAWIASWALRNFALFHGERMPPAARTYWLLALSILLVLGTTLTPRRWHGVPALLAIALLAFDAPGFEFHKNHHFEPRQFDGPRFALVKSLPGLRDWRVYDEFVLEPRSGSRLLLREMRGYQAFDPLATMAYRQIVIEARSRPQVLAEYNVRYIFRDPHYRTGWGTSTFAQPPSVMQPAFFKPVSPQVEEANHPAPHLAWYGRVKVAAGPQVIPTLATLRDEQGRRHAAVIDELALQDAHFRPRLSPLLEGDDAGPPREAVAGRVTRFEADEVHGTIVAPGAGLVVLNEAHYPGWRAFVDGEETPILTVDGILRGIFVTAGAHEVVWRYSPPGWSALLTAWWAGLLVFIATGLRALSRLRAAGPRI